MRREIQSGMRGGNTKKTNNALLYTSTEHATTRSADGHQWTVNIGNTIYAEKVDSIAPLQVTLANIFPNVTQYNNAFTVSNGDGAVNVVVPVGQYTATVFASTVTTQLAGVNVTLTLNADDKFVFTSTNAHGNTTVTSTLIDAWHLLGYANADGVTFAQTTATTAPYVPNMSGEKIVHIACDKLAHGNLVYGDDGSLHDIFVTIHLTDTTYGFNATFLPQQDETYHVDYKYANSVTSTLDFQLLDSKLRPLPYPLNHHVQIVFRLHHHENTTGV